MKRTLMIFIIFAMVLFFALPAFAADTVTNTTAEPGDTVTFSMQIPQEIKAQAGGIAISYDQQFLQLENGRWKLEDTMVAPFFKDTALGAFAFSTETSISGEIFTVTFKVRDDAPAGRWKNSRCRKAYERFPFGKLRLGRYDVSHG